MQRLKKMLAEHEGRREFAYQDSSEPPKWHIGVGRNIDANGGIGLSNDEIDMLLDNDVVRVMRELANALPWYKQIDEVRQDVLVMMSFNLGLPRLLKFEKAIAAMQAGHFETAAAEMLDSRWHSQVGARARVLAAMMETGTYPDGND